MCDAVVAYARTVVSSSRVLVTLSICVVALTISGCATPGLMATPNIYLDPEARPFDSVTGDYREPDVQLIYATDRQPLPDADRSPFYGHLRSHTLAFGVGTVELGENLTWDELVTASTSEKRERKLVPRLVSVEEPGRTPHPAQRYKVKEEQLIPDEEVLAHERELGAQACEVLTERLRHTDRKEVFLFVHGYNVQFDEALITIAEIWHFLGRPGVPVAYSWPAGRGGIRGYTTDRESGEFTISHLKQFIRALMQCESVEKINVLAHSRGTDVALTALRELHLEARQDDGSYARRDKFQHLVLAAADLDMDVVTQRIGAEGLFFLPQRFTMYVSDEDRAIGLATWLFDSVRRVGKLRSTDLSDLQKERQAAHPELELVDSRIKRPDFFGHSYFYQHPAVSSDLILLLRDNLQPGVEGGRPLRREDVGFWEIYEGYPYDPIVEDESAPTRSRY